MKALNTAPSSARPRPSTPPKRPLMKSPPATYSLARSSTWYSASRSRIRSLRCSWSNQPGALSVSARTWSAMTGTIATTNSVTPARKAVVTVRTAKPRRRPRRSRKSTAGCSPAARKSETTMSSSVEPIASRVVPSHQAVRAPRPPKKPR